MAAISTPPSKRYTFVSPARLETIRARLRRKPIVTIPKLRGDAAVQVALEVGAPHGWNEAVWTSIVHSLFGHPSTSYLLWIEYAMRGCMTPITDICQQLARVIDDENMLRNWSCCLVALGHLNRRHAQGDFMFPAIAGRCEAGMESPLELAHRDMARHHVHRGDVGFVDRLRAISGRRDTE